MTRPTIRDLAEAADVSIATVNRVLSGSSGVKQKTMERVKEAAEAIGFYNSGAIENRVYTARPRYKFGFLLHQPSRAFYKNVAKALQAAAERATTARVEAKIEFLDDLAPQNIAARLLALGEECHAVGVVAAVHPIVSRAVETLQERRKPVFALISQLASTGLVHYVGIDGFKVGRTAAWVFEHVGKVPGKLGILVGNPRYRCQEMNESGFRSYFREHAPGFTLLEPLLTFENASVAQEMTEKLVAEHPDLQGLYVAGGGISGAVAGLRASGMAGKITVVGYELMDVTREALLDGTITFVISHPLDRLADEAINGMIRAAGARSDGGNYTSVLPFDIFTRENI